VEVDRIYTVLTSHGLTAKVSSIHVNAWYGTHDKLSMTKRLMREQFGVDLDAGRDDFAFIGDSPNDEPMFAYFPNSFAVANIAPFVDELDHPPACVVEAEEGAGFVLFAERVLAARAAVR
jgi:hydroxymethylpyrimidine pyrophosphatase-like HAD family hydrolase